MKKALLIITSLLYVAGSSAWINPWLIFIHNKTDVPYKIRETGKEIPARLVTRIDARVGSDRAGRMPYSGKSWMHLDAQSSEQNYREYLEVHGVRSHEEQYNSLLTKAEKLHASIAPYGFYRTWLDSAPAEVRINNAGYSSWLSCDNIALEIKKQSTDDYINYNVICITEVGGSPNFGVIISNDNAEFSVDPIATESRRVVHFGMK